MVEEKVEKKVEANEKRKKSTWEFMHDLIKVFKNDLHKIKEIDEISTSGFYAFLGESENNYLTALILYFNDCDIDTIKVLHDISEEDFDRIVENWGSEEEVE